ncbi:MAG: sensor histidine kinase [Hyphomicrobiales bacterium]|nr:MAG: sensor histidine kinase [Hyphomicrobiales bacterium]
MRLKSGALRIRLLLGVMLVLCVMAVLAVAGRYFLAAQTTQGLYDKTLLTVAHTISRDVVLSGGDLLAEELLETLNQSLGDQVFYHVDGAEFGLITGYSDPPPLPKALKVVAGKASFYDAVYRGDNVRVVTMREFIAREDGQAGWMNIQVWQTVHQRDALSMQLATRTALIMALLLLAALIAVWIAVNRALRPLLDLKDAVEHRSPDDLTAIRRPVPDELKSLVTSMNSLFARLRKGFADRDMFISNAAHQLRNPIAGILSQAEAAAQSRTEQDLRSRSREVAEAARRASRLTRQLLSMEKARGRSKAHNWREFDLVELAAKVTSRMAPQALRGGVRVEFHRPDGPAMMRGDTTLIEEALDNLIDNALLYGAAPNGTIDIGVEISAGLYTLYVADNGPPIPEAKREKIFERFVRGKEGGGGCGLGLAIVREIAEGHDGGAAYRVADEGARFEMRFPRP